MPSKTTKSRKASMARGVVLFIGAAVPGVFLFLFSLGRLFLAAVEPEYRTLLNFLLLAAGLSLGSIAMLVGTQRWGQWLHLLVLVSLPFLWFMMLAAMAGLELQRLLSPIIPATITTIAIGVWCSRRIDRHYKDEATSRAHGQPGV